jgi:hypothetical protein
LQEGLPERDARNFGGGARRDRGKPYRVRAPRLGRKNYYVGSHARSIIGWNGIDSPKLIDELTRAS